MTFSEVKQLIAEHLPDAEVSVSGADGKFEAIVISPQFKEMNKVARHQIVYAGIQQYIADGSIHALSIRTYTPEEYAGKQIG